jgi:hypothetical protein
VAFFSVPVYKWGQKGVIVLLIFSIAKVLTCFGVRGFFNTLAGVAND